MSSSPTGMFSTVVGQAVNGQAVGGSGRVNQGCRQ